MGVLKQLGRVLIFRDSPRVPTDLLEKVLIFRDSGGFFVTDRKTNTYTLQHNISSSSSS